eukprot:10906170-Ditylum_brightwellii.AAC.1
MRLASFAWCTDANCGMLGSCGSTGSVKACPANCWYMLGVTVFLWTSFMTSKVGSTMYLGMFGCVNDACTVSASDNTIVTEFV